MFFFNYMFSSTFMSDILISISRKIVKDLKIEKKNYSNVIIKNIFVFIYF
jgi:hypothetical protein